MFFVDDGFVPLGELEVLDWSLPPELEPFRKSTSLEEPHRPPSGPWVSPGQAP